MNGRSPPEGGAKHFPAPPAHLYGMIIPLVTFFCKVIIMATITFDTYTAIKRLKSVGFDEQQAEALSDTIRDAQEAKLDELATRKDIKELEVKIAEAKAETIKWMFGVATGQALFVLTLLKMFPAR
ncbi:MAG: CCDC90 family protein [Magnetococcus sp. YQC-5]